MSRASSGVATSMFRASSTVRMRVTCSALDRRRAPLPQARHRGAGAQELAGDVDGKSALPVGQGQGFDTAGRAGNPGIVNWAWMASVSTRCCPVRSMARCRQLARTDPE